MTFFQQYILGINVGSEICCAIFDGLILLAVYVKQNRTRESNAFSFFLFTMILALISDICAYVFITSRNVYLIEAICNCMSYTMTILSVYGFYCYLLTRSEVYYGTKFGRLFTIWGEVYIILCPVLYISSLWTGAIFSIGEDGTYITGPYAYLTFVVLTPLFILQYYIIFRNIRKAPVLETVLYVVFVTMFGILGAIDALYVTAFHYIAMTVFAVLIYILIEIEQEKSLTVKSKELAISELNALRLQMNPHYIYNVLASIDGLIIFDPDGARKLIGKFIKHLRGSYLDDMPDMIDVSTELENLEYYIAVEKTRFPNLNVVFDIKADNFQLPPLVIQPMVENAIKYGICGRDNSSGTVTIETYETDSTYNVRISDDGIGFDVNGSADDSRSHIGIQNTRKRLQLLCKGRLELNSIKGLGSEVTVIIPKE